MSSYNIVFKGEFVPGFSKEKLRANLISAFRISTEKADSFFTQTKVTLKKDLPHNQAIDYQRKLTKLGLYVDLEPNNIAPAPALSISTEPELSLSKLEETTPKRHVPRDTLVETEAESRERTRSLPTEVILPMLIVLVGLVMIITFSPAGDGILRTGAVAGLLMMLFGCIKVSSIISNSYIAK